MRFASFPTINSVLSNVADLRQYSLNLVGVYMENRSPMTRRDGASELPQSNEGCDPPQGGKHCTPPPRGPGVPDFKTDLHLNSYDAS
jgi:hypothetical protein